MHSYQPSKKRKLNVDSQPLTLQPRNPYPDENDRLPLLKKILLSELRDSTAWVEINNPCGEIGENFSDLQLVIFVVRINQLIFKTNAKFNDLLLKDLDNVGCAWMRALHSIPHSVLVGVSTLILNIPF